MVMEKIGMKVTIIMFMIIKIIIVMITLVAVLVMIIFMIKIIYYCNNSNYGNSYDN